MVKDKTEKKDSPTPSSTDRKASVFKKPGKKDKSTPGSNVGSPSAALLSVTFSKDMKTEELPISEEEIDEQLRHFLEENSISEEIIAVELKKKPHQKYYLLQNFKKKEEDMVCLFISCLICISYLCHS